MVWNRNEGQNCDDILQNQFTAYLLNSVKRRRAHYIEQAVRDLQAKELMDDSLVVNDFDIDNEAFRDDPVYMRLQNEKLYAALFQLTEREQYVFFNRVLNEKSYKELGAELGLSDKGVAAVYYRTVQRIRKLMRGGK